MSEFFVRRPIVAIVIAILMTLIGGVCILALPIAQYPQIAPPEIQVQTHYTGADALTIEQSVAAPIEQQMSGVDNMNYMYSINANSGDIRLIVNFDVATDPNIDQVLTQLRVSQAQSQLPADVNNYGVTVKKSTTAPLMLVALYSPKGTYDEFFSRTTATSIWSINSRACRELAMCRFSAPANTRCGCGSSRTNWRSSASLCRTSSRRCRSRTR